MHLLEASPLPLCAVIKQKKTRNKKCNYSHKLLLTRERAVNFYHLLIRVHNPDGKSGEIM